MKITEAIYKTFGITETIKKTVEKQVKEEVSRQRVREWLSRQPKVEKKDDSLTWRKERNLQKAFEYWERNPIANSGLKYKIAYILGKGLQYESKVEPIKEFLDKFWETNNLDLGHIELIKTVFLNGEAFLYFVPNQNREIKEEDDSKDRKISIGQIPIMVSYDSSEIKYIATDPENNIKPLYYHRQYNLTTYPSIESNSPTLTGAPVQKNENIPADEMIHFKIDTISNLSRGRGMLDRGFDYLEEYDIWLQTRIKLNRALSAFVYWLQMGNDNKTDINTWQQKLIDFATYDTNGNLIETFPSGQPIVTGKSMTLHVLSPDIGASKASEDGRKILLMTAVALGLPEFMLSDGENANLATTTSQMSPMIKLMEMDQEAIRLMFKQIFNKALTLGIEAGTIEEQYPIKIQNDDGSIEEITKPALELYDLIMPEIAASDVAELATAVRDLVQYEVLSRETSCTMLGYEWDIEKDKITNEKKQGFVSPVPTQGQGIFGMAESMGRMDLKRVEKLKDECQEELQENYGKYKEDILSHVPNAKEQFIRKHKEIVVKYLNRCKEDAYTSKVH